MKMNSGIRQAIINSLRFNMGYRKEESVLIVGQDWQPKFGQEKYKPIRESYDCAYEMYETFRHEGIDARFLGYYPEEARHGVDAPRMVYEAAEAWDPDIVFMPTAFSLTHTAFRKNLTSKWVRVASMPTFTLEMFAEGGPMSADFAEMQRLTEEAYQNLKAHDVAYIIGPGTSMIVEIDKDLVHASSGKLDKPGDYGNLPGAEAYVVPRHLGKSEGYFTVPIGWGGQNPLQHEVTFFVKDGRITRIGDLKAGAVNDERERYLEEIVKPMILPEFGAKPGYNVLAELGIGTNPNVDAEYIERHGWSPLLAEKIVGSAHFANGNSKGMGGQNDVDTHIDWVVPGVKISYR
jgi:leucyl aminopeptidase (aminopeptidase T)